MDVMLQVSSLQRMSCCDAFSSPSVVSRVFSVLCVYSTFRHHPHPLRYLCANLVSSEASIAELAHGEKRHTQSLYHSPSLFENPGTKAFTSEKLVLRADSKFCDVMLCYQLKNTISLCRN